MKHLSLLIITLFFTISAIAQPWIEPTAGNVYYQGNVGIGTTGPRSVLDVTGTTALSWGVHPLGLVTMGTEVTGGSLFLNTPSGTSGYGAGLGITGSNFGGTLGTLTNINSYGVYYADYYSELAFSTTNGTFLNEAMRIKSNGNVGIGTTNPGAKLEINGYGGSALRIQGNSADPYYYTDFFEGYAGGLNIITKEYAQPDTQLSLFRGKVGIGTLNPTVKLDVNGTISTFTGADRGTYAIDQRSALDATGISLLRINSGGWTNVSIPNGNVGIGTTTPEAKLTVKGKIVASEIQVKDIGVIADYVFKPDYPLMSLDKVENFVKQNQHLPEVPSEKEFKKDGMNVAEMNALLLKKVEELTLYAIKQNQNAEEQNKKVEKLTLYAIEQNKKIEALEKAMNNLNSK